MPRKNRWIWLGALTLLCLGAFPKLGAEVLVGPFVPGSGRWTTVANGALEAAPGPLPVVTTDALTGNWHLFTSAGAAGTAEFTPQAAFMGQTGVRIQPTSTYNGPGIALTLGQLVPTVPGQSYVVSAFIRRHGPVGSEAKVFLDLWGSAGGVPVFSESIAGWQFVYGVFTAETPTVGIRSSNGGATNPADAWDVDELAITPLEQFTPPIPAANSFPRLLNINFGVDLTPARRGPAAIGLATNDVWNLYSRDGRNGGFRQVGSLTNLLWSDGSESPVDLSITNAPGAWNNEYPDPMFGIYLYPLGGGPNITVGLHDLPPGLYQVYAYGHGGPPDLQNTVFNLRADGVDYGDQATAANASWKSAQWIEGAQYVRFAGVRVGPDRSMLLTAKPGASPLAHLNGLQLVYVGSEALAFSPAPGLFTNRVEVHLLGGAAGGTIRYTLDGSEPRPDSTRYTEPIRLSTAAIIRARLFSGSEPASSILSAQYLRVYAVDDGIPADWRAQFFGPGYRTDPRVAAEADPDDDGASNLQEFGNRSHPLDPLSGFAVAVRLIPSINWRSVQGTTYRVLRKDNLADPEWTEVARVTASGTRTTFSDASVSDVPRYYLIEAVRP